MLQFIDSHFTALICLAYTGIAAWLANRLLVAVVASNVTNKF